MKYASWFIAGALLAGATGFASTDCANADGTIVYHAWQYEGGAGPPPGMHTGHSEVVYKGQVVAKADYYAGGGHFEQLPIEFSEQAHSRVEIANNSHPASIDTTYAHTATLTRVDGSAVFPDRADKAVTDIFLCHQVQHFYP